MAVERLEDALVMFEEVDVAESGVDAVLEPVEARLEVAGQGEGLCGVQVYWKSGRAQARNSSSTSSWIRAASPLRPWRMQAARRPQRITTSSGSRRTARTRRDHGSPTPPSASVMSDDERTVFDVLGRDGRLRRRVEVPGVARVVGFGPDGVYIARKDAFDLEWLERYPR